MTCVPWELALHLLGRWFEEMWEGGGVLPVARPVRLQPGVGVVERIKVPNWFLPNLSWLMWQVAAVSASPPRPRLSPPGSSLWHCADAADAGKELHCCSRSQVHTHARTRTHAHTDGRRETVEGSRGCISGWRQSQAEAAQKYTQRTHTHIRVRTHLHMRARRHSTPVTQCYAELLTHQTHVSDTNYSRGLDEESVAWPWHRHTQMNPHSCRAGWHTHNYSADKEQVNMMTLVNNSRENWEWKRERSEQKELREMVDIYSK